MSVPMHLETPNDQPVVVVAVNSSYDFSRDAESVIAQALTMMAMSEAGLDSSPRSVPGNKSGQHNVLVDAISSVEHALASLRAEIAEDLL